MSGHLTPTPVTIKETNREIPLLGFNNLLECSQDSGKQLTYNHQFIMKAATQEQTMGELQRARYWEGAGLPSLGPPPSTSVCSPTCKSPEPQSLGVRMELP